MQRYLAQGVHTWSPRKMTCLADSVVGSGKYLLQLLETIDSIFQPLGQLPDFVFAWF